MYNVEKIGSESADILSTLWINTFQQAYEGVHTPDNIKAYCQNNFSIRQAQAELNDEATLCKFGFKNEQPVGYYILKSKNTALELKQIYILADHYGTGLGKALFNDAMIEARKSYHTELWLAVSDINQRALSFYNKLGFTAKGDGPVFKVGSDRLTSTIMALKL